MISRVLGIALLVALGFSPASAEQVKVSIDNFTFNPAELTVKVGTTITFENGDDIPH